MDEFDPAILNQTENGFTALMCSIILPNEALFDRLLAEPKVDLNIRNEQGWTALMIAVFHEREEMVKRLLERGADKNVLNNDKKSAYDVAVKAGLPKIEELLKSPNFNTIKSASKH